MLRSPKNPNGIELYSEIKNGVESGELRPGDRLLPSRDLQKKFAMSYHATLNVLKRLEDEGVLITRRGAGTFILDQKKTDEKRSDGARILVIESILSGDARILLGPMLKSFQKKLDAAGASRYHISLPLDVEGQRHAREETLEAIEAFKAKAEKDIDVCVWFVSSLPRESELPSNLPLVMASPDIDNDWAENKGYDIITSDPIQGGMLAARHLREAGCKSAAVIGAMGATHPHPNPTTTKRIEGFIKGWGEPIPDDHILTVRRFQMKDSAQVSPKLLKMKPRPDAIFCVSDGLAEGAYSGLTAHGVDAGEEIKIMGFDAHPDRKTAGFILTSVQVPLEQIGREAARMALERAAKPDTPVRRLAIACGIREGCTA